ncbi:CPBP family intramembrane glutamic endopeptidase [Pengzhenrongella sicca]|uniref:CPBP family intramembrane metalloprotease n=1 Tax=Pengzhenrongella sicca TaxID=2819238 RepID=A0A8A4ZJB4_9MICO|nr:CPBP family intramembrane glutamic endopeptidase [Pengzhenrongella sicca]QTE31059.1 CPBP family intramembrane metalloprotease [Pengzhenrongella sicca]
MTTLTNDTLAGRKIAAPGWPELFAGAAAYAASFALVAVLLPLIADDAISGVVGLVVSGLMGMIALAVAARIRIRGLSAFGFRRASSRQLIVGAALGLAAFVIGSTAVVVYALMSGDVQNVQTTYQAGAEGGLMSLMFTLVAGAIITPIGEEAFFRGVVANTVLARFGPLVGIIVSAAIFAVAHGINPVMIVAFIVGVLTAVLFRWSGSIWPGVMLHGVNNATVFLLPVVSATVTG